MKIVVLCGGISAERDVSLSTGAMAAAALRRLGHRVAAVDLFLGVPEISSAPDALDALFTSAPDAADAKIAASAPNLAEVRRARVGGAGRVGENVFALCSRADIVFTALHGEDGEDGKIQAALDLLGVRYTGTGVLGSALAMNKSVAKELFAAHGILTPRGLTLRRGGAPFANPGFPCVVKPCSGGSSVGTAIAANEDEYIAALGAAFAFGGEAVAEQYIRGRECDVGVLAGRALPVIEICPKSGFYDYANKYQSGLTDEYCPADLPPALTERLQRAAEDVFRALRLEVYARMDFMVAPGGEIYCLEGNTLPGLTPTSLLPQEAAAAGIGYDALVDAILRESILKYGGAL
ncbi:MAG: D-alanine--D-alanine ligase [Oscillospiraceae bacterium]|nr:D-alanine--D-alanine ligase [Oscillospiraceae bacterium]